MLHTTLAVAAILAATLAAGCGEASKGGSTHTSETTTAAGQTQTTVALKPATGAPLTRTQLIARADAVCARTNTKLASISVITRKEFGRVLPQVALYDAAEVEALSKLVPPTAMAHDWNEILHDFQSYTQDAYTVGGYARVNNYKAAKPYLEGGIRTRQALDTIAAKNGFQHCSTPY